MPDDRMTIETQIAQRLFGEFQQALTWGQLVSAVQASTEQDKTYLINTLRTGRYKDVGRRLQQIVTLYLRNLAQDEADAMMADNSLSRAELDRIL